MLLIATTANGEPTPRTVRPDSGRGRENGPIMTTTVTTEAQLDQLAINTIRTLSMDAVQAANSGHPGTPMALAPLVYTLWNRVMRFDPAGSDLARPRPLRAVERPRLDAAVVGAAPHGHAGRECRVRNGWAEPSVTLDDIRRFRQFGSHAPGHPEYRLVSGVETTTGPLGQGIATSVGMAIAQRWLAVRYNKPGFDHLRLRHLRRMRRRLPDGGRWL